MGVYFFVKHTLIYSGGNILRQGKISHSVFGSLFSQRNCTHYIWHGKKKLVSANFCLFELIFNRLIFHSVQ